MNPFPHELWRIGTFSITDSLLLSAVVSVALVCSLKVAMQHGRAREGLEVIYEALEQHVRSASSVDVAPLVPLILTQWLFIAVANLVGLLPRLAAPTRDLSLAVALSFVALLAGHVHAVRQHGLRYLKQYIEPHPLLLPLNLIGEVSRSVALSLRLFGNMVSSTLVGAIVLLLAGLLVPVPLMLMSVLSAAVQAYIFGILTLVFAASSLESAAANQVKLQAMPPGAKT